MYGRKYWEKRDIHTDMWYMLDLSDPSYPMVPHNCFSTKDKCIRKIERYFGYNSLMVPVKGRELVKYNVLLAIQVKRTWGVLMGGDD